MSFLQPGDVVNDGDVSGFDPAVVAIDGSSGADCRVGETLTPEPVFGIIKSVLGFRQFSMRGLERARGEWSLVTMAWNIKRMFALNPA